jgi:alpha,alpha-trehalose phosphorylase
MARYIPDLEALGSDPWRLLELVADHERAALHERLFTLGNGHISVGGGHEEGRVWPGTVQDVTSIAGVLGGPSRVSVPNGKAIRWWVDGEPFDPSVGRVGSYRRLLDFRTGLLSREFVWVSPGGRSIEVRSRRLVCLEREHVYALEYELRPLRSGVRLVIESTLDAQSQAVVSGEDPTADSTPGSGLERIAFERAGNRVTLTHRMRRSGSRVASAIEQMLHVVAARAVLQEECGDDDSPGLSFSVSLAAGERAILTKYCALVGSPDGAVEGLEELAARQLGESRSKGFSALCVEQQARLTRFWQEPGVAIDGDDAQRQRQRFELLQLLQSGGRDGRYLPPDFATVP